MEGLNLIIPCYNEGPRIFRVLNEALKVQKINKIIIVDDGSDLETKKVLEIFKKNPQIKIITHEKNLGKTAALASGIKQAKFQDLLFLDADLKNLTSDHVTRIIDVYQGNNLEILLAGREKELFIFTLFGSNSVSWGGERIVNKKIFVENPEVLKVSGYLYEPIFMQKTFGKYKIGKFILKGVGQTWKVEKEGIKGFLKDLKMHYDYAKFLGLRGYFWQAFLAGRNIKEYF